MPSIGFSFFVAFTALTPQITNILIRFEQNFPLFLDKSYYLGIISKNLSKFCFPLILTKVLPTKVRHQQTIAVVTAWYWRCSRNGDVLPYQFLQQQEVFSNRGQRTLPLLSSRQPRTSHNHCRIQPHQLTLQHPDTLLLCGRCDRNIAWHHQIPGQNDLQSLQYIIKQQHWRKNMNFSFPSQSHMLIYVRQSKNMTQICSEYSI